MLWLQLSAALMILTALTHSLVGEQRLIQPILAQNTPLTNNMLARQVIRYAWHLTSVLMVLSALTLLWTDSPPSLRRMIGLTWLCVGLFDAVVTRGRHIGWPMLTGAGLFALIGSFA